MSIRPRKLLHRNSVFVWIAVVTCGLLCIPLIAMQLGTAVDWDATDFIIMGVLMFGMASLFVLVARRAPRKHHLVLAAAFLLAFLVVWVELAVGIFTRLGS